MVAVLPGSDSELRGLSHCKQGTLVGFKDGGQGDNQFFIHGALILSLHNLGLNYSKDARQP